MLELLIMIVISRSYKTTIHAWIYGYAHNMITHAKTVLVNYTHLSAVRWLFSVCASVNLKCVSFTTVVIDVNFFCLARYIILNNSLRLPFRKYTVRKQENNYLIIRYCIIFTQRPKDNNTSTKVALTCNPRTPAPPFAATLCSNNYQKTAKVTNFSMEHKN